MGRLMSGVNRSVPSMVEGCRSPLGLFCFLWSSSPFPKHSCLLQTLPVLIQRRPLTGILNTTDRDFRDAEINLQHLLQLRFEFTPKFTPRFKFKFTPKFKAQYSSFLFSFLTRRSVMSPQFSQLVHNWRNT